MAAVTSIGLLIGNCVMSALIIGLPKRLGICGRSRRSIRFRYRLVHRRRGIISRIVVHRIEDRNGHKSPLLPGMWTAKMHMKTLIAPEPNLVAGDRTRGRRGHARGNSMQDDAAVAIGGRRGCRGWYTVKLGLCCLHSKRQEK